MKKNRKLILAAIAIALAVIGTVCLFCCENLTVGMACNTAALWISLAVHKKRR